MAILDAFLDWDCIVVLAAIITVLVTIWLTRREQWITLYFEYNKRFAEIRRQLPEDILSDCFDVSTLEEKQWRYMREYFVLCSEEFFLKEKKKWIARKLGREWERANKYYMGKLAFRKAWQRVRNEDIYYKDFVPFMDTLAGIRETNEG